MNRYYSSIFYSFMLDRIGTIKDLEKFLIKDKRNKKLRKRKRKGKRLNKIKYSPDKLLTRDDKMRRSVRGRQGR